MIKRIAAVAGFALVLVLPAFGQNTQRFGKVVITGWSQMSVEKSHVVFSGPEVYIRTIDGQFAAKAAKIVVTSASQGKTGGSLQSASLTGNVWTLIKPAPGQSTEAKADAVDVDWSGNRTAVLKGNVHLKSTDPSMFQGPADLVVDRATVNLKPESQLKPGETRLMLQGDPSKTKIEFMPLEPANDTEKPATTEQK